MAFSPSYGDSDDNDQAAEVDFEVDRDYLITAADGNVDYRG